MVQEKQIYYLTSWEEVKHQRKLRKPSLKES